MRNTAIVNDRQLSRVFAALGDNTRYKIVKLLLQDKNICVGKIAETLDISPSAVSQHCRLLELTGIVSRNRIGQQTCYQVEVRDKRVRKLIKLMDIN